MRFQLDPRGPSLYRHALPSHPHAKAAATATGTAGPTGAPAGPTMAAAPTPTPGGSRGGMTSLSSGGSFTANVPVVPFDPQAPTVPRPRSAPARKARDPARTKLYAILAVGVLVLAGAGLAAAYALELPPFEYPRRYMLEGGEVPARMELMDLPADAEEEFGITENPGRIDRDRLAEFGQGPAPEPKDGWAEVLTPTSTPAPVVVLALRFADEDAAKTWASLVSTQCSRGGGAVLQDGDVAVLVFGEGTTASAHAGRVVDALEEEAPALNNLCE